MSALDSPLRVSLTLDWLSRYIVNHSKLWIKAGNLETALVAFDIEDIAIEKPVYICGLARSGSTVLLETLAARPGAVTHRYQDFPFLFTPYWWNLLLKLMPWRDKTKRERAHGDGILINAESPEAMEEMLWVAFFPKLHSASASEVFDTAPRRAFEKFYRAHVQKLLLIRKGARYVSKGNYNVTRLDYLHSLFPDARFIIPIREPVSHIVSLMRQHERFTAAGKKDPRIPRHMALAGHFEFGLNRMPIHTGDDKRMQEIKDAWQRGDEIRGWALYWDAIYRFLHTQLENNPALKAQTLIVRFEDLCARPKEELRRVFSHADLPIDESELTALAAQFHAPNYPSPLSESDTALIRDITGKTAKSFGYTQV